MAASGPNGTHNHPCCIAGSLKPSPCCFAAVMYVQNKQLNTMTYMNRRSSERWTEAETNLFYRALTMFGTDFTAIAALFPNRDR